MSGIASVDEHRRQHEESQVPVNSTEQQPLLHGRPSLRRSSTSSSSSSRGYRGTYQSSATPQSSSGETVVAMGEPTLSSQAAVPEKLRQHYAWTRERFSLKWWLEWTAIFIVFSITGSSSMMLVRPLMGLLGLEGSMKEGPWLYRIDPA
ncbi:hypothetical protein BGW42_007213 [Actinomortierella wolfii]|nr:hypothetical protein BGW42_007213 [Actinomortierella wolfii]